ncbi:hypothetical protein ACTQ6A_13950 [Lachnospiraceae bacterium LCP25S3_G4]
MSKTNELRKLVMQLLKTKCENIYYENAVNESMYPHVVFALSDINNNDLNRSDITLEIDIWDKSESAFLIENLSDEIEELFRSKNIPSNTILPTFYLIDRRKVLDEDKKIKHRLVRVLIQNYER